jgi:hypothetical protein
MNLSRMRDIGATDPIGGLGPRVTPDPTPAPEPVKRPDGFIESPDGKLSTDLPEPPTWPFPSANHVSGPKHVISGGSGGGAAPDEPVSCLQDVMTMRVVLFRSDGQCITLQEWTQP